MFALRMQVAGEFLHMPWIPVHQQQLVVPKPRSIRTLVEPVTTNFPGYSLAVSEVLLRDFDESPFIP